MAVKLGKQTWTPGKVPVIIQTGTVVGPVEGEGPLRDWFDHVYTDPMAGERSFEHAEKEMMLNACYTALHKAGKTPESVDLFLAGDLLNQIIASGFAALELQIPFLGLYGACATSAESLAVAAALIDAGFARLVLWGRSRGLFLPPVLAPAEMAQRIGSLLPEEEKEDLAYLVEVYHRERYGGERADRRTRLLYRRAWERVVRSGRGGQKGRTE